MTSFNPWPHHVSAQVNAEYGHGAQRQGDVGDDEQQEWGDLGDVTGQGVGDGFLQVVKDQAACGEVLRASGRPEHMQKPCCLARGRGGMQTFAEGFLPASL